MTQLETQAVATEVDTEVDAAADMYADDTGVETNTDQPDLEPEGDGEGDQQQGDEPEQPAIAAPHSWKAEAKETFATLPRDVQEYISQRETEQTRLITQKAQEAAQARQTAQTEFAQQFVQLRQQAAEQLDHYAAMFDVPPPNPQLLYGDEAQRFAYHQQDAEYRASQAQRQQAQQQAGEMRQQAEQAEQKLIQQHMQAEQAKLADAIPEWNDPATRQTLLTELQSVGAALNYPPELMAEAKAHDILALRQAAQWKQAFDREQARSKAKTSPVPRKPNGQFTSVAPGTSRGQPTPTDAMAALYPDDVRR